MVERYKKDTALSTRNFGEPLADLPGKRGLKRQIVNSQSMCVCLCVFVCRLAPSCARVDTRNHFMVLGWRPISYYCQLLLWRTAVKRNGDDDDDDDGG